MTPGLTVRPARADEAAALTELEQAANLVGLAHVFDPARHTYPEQAVRARWQRLLEQPDVVVEVTAAADRRLVCLLARDATRVRHLAVRPDHTGRGLAGTALARAEAAIRAGGRTPVLTCLEANHRARGLYEARGWRLSGDSRPSEFPPHPVELDYTLPPEAP